MTPSCRCICRRCAAWVMCWCRTAARPMSARRLVADFAPGKFIKRFLPRGLFGRSFIMILAPMVLLLGVVTYYFFELDLDATTRRLARDVVADCALLVTLEDSTPALERDAVRALAARQLRYRLTFHDGATLPPTPPPSSTIDVALDDIIANRVGPNRHFSTGRIGEDFDIKVETHDGVLEIAAPRDRVTVLGPDIFILLTVGTTLIVLAIAIL